MKIAAVCCTYKRPRILEQAIESFLRQDYPAHLRSMLILDDAGQYDNQGRDGWTLVSVPTRFRTMGEKRNAAMAMAGDVDVYCVWDDDDIYLPWHMSAAAAALADADYTIPSQVWFDSSPKFRLQENDGRHHGSWSFRRAAVSQVRGYPFEQSGHDYGLVSSFEKAKMLLADPILFDKRPSYIYRWFTAHRTHLSDRRRSYEDYARIPCEHVASINPYWSTEWVRIAEKAMPSPDAVA